jgi:glutamate formiminotransferase/formiminotetrahydrofolate cyclodeaminase
MDSGIAEGMHGYRWYIEEYGIAQVSINLTNISVDAVTWHSKEASKKAQKRGMRVSGSELVGLIPKKAMLDAGKYFLKKQQRSLGVSKLRSSRLP